MDDKQKPKAEIVPGRNGGTIKPVRSPEQARELARKRWDKKTQAIREGMAAAANQMPDLNANPYEVIKHAAEQGSMLVMTDPDSPRAPAWFKLLLQHGFPAPERATGEQGAVPPELSSMTLEQARELLEYLRGLRGKQATVVEHQPGQAGNHAT